MSSWGCPHEADGKCSRLKYVTCDPGLKGCVLRGRVRFSNEAQDTAKNTAKNTPRQKRAGVKTKNRNPIPRSR